MSATTARRRSRSRRMEVLHKPRGTFHPCVPPVGPEHFGVGAVDCAKARSKWMLCDFYGNVLVPPTVVEHKRVQLDAALARLGQAVTEHHLGDLIVAVERTGRYHRPVQRAFAAAGYEVRILHPFATKQFRQSNDPGTKTDDTDLAALPRAAVNGCALVEAPRDETWRTFQLLIRQRRDLVQKTRMLCCPIREHLDAAYPGFAAGFDKLWDSACAWHLLRHFASPQHIQAAGVTALCHSLDAAGVR